MATLINKIKTRAAALTMALAVVCTCNSAAIAQTKIDLSTQTRNVDFSAAASTKPVRTGASLPATCATGEIFFLLTASPGANLFACTATNIWSAPAAPSGGGGGGNSGATTAAVFPSTINSNQLLIGAGSFRIGTTVVNLPAGATVTPSGATSGIVRVYANANGQVVVGHNMGAGVVATSSSGYLIDAASTGYPVGTIPLFECQLTAGRFSSSCTDLRALLHTDGMHAGASGLVSVDCPTGVGCTVDVLTSLVPNKAAANAFTGLNTFTQLQIPVVSTLAATDCDDSAKAGRVVYLNSAPTGKRLYACEGLSGWVLQGR